MENIKDLVKQVNALLLAGEPGNISVDDHGAGGAVYTGYKPQAIIDAMFEAFPVGAWGFEELSNDIEPTEKGGLAVAKVKVWFAGVDFQPTGWGQNRVTRGDIGDGRKGAQTDAIKKALSYFSIGNRAYHGLLVAPPKENNQQRSTQQPNKPATQRPTNPAPINAPTKPATSTKTEPPAENKNSGQQFTKLEDAPSVPDLKKQVVELQIKNNGGVMDWQAVLAHVFKNQIADKTLSLKALTDANDLPEELSLKVAKFLYGIKVARSKAA